MWPFKNHASDQARNLQDTEALNRLETRVERLELDHAERQVAVLSALEKVLNQLRARERKRAITEDAGEGDSLGGVDRRPGNGSGDLPDLHPPKRALRRF